MIDRIEGFIRWHLHCWRISRVTRSLARRGIIWRDADGYYRPVPDRPDA